VGVNGHQQLSPFKKAFEPDDATVSLRPLTANALPPGFLPEEHPNNPKTLSPTLRLEQEFLEEDDGNDFKRLTGAEGGEEVETLAEWPTSFLHLDF
jgi:hypothetical protein